MRILKIIKIIKIPIKIKCKISKITQGELVILHYFTYYFINVSRYLVYKTNFCLISTIPIEDLSMIWLR